LANPIRVIGIGPGNPDYITPLAVALIKSSDVLVGGERILAPFAGLGKESYPVRNNLKEMVKFIEDRRRDRVVAVLASGDPGFYGILEYLKKHFPREELQVVPGISSVQLACARLCISWQDAVFYSVHGRNMEGLAELVRLNSKVIVLTDPQKTPGVIARELVSGGISHRKVYICENLSYEDERIEEYDLAGIPQNVGASGCVMLITDSGG